MAAPQPVAPAFAGIVTPEAVVLELDTAGVASRVFAALIDLGVQLLLFYAGALVIVTAGGSSDESSATTGAVIMLAAVLLGYPVLLETWLRGRTIGKLALRLRAVTVEGAPIRFRHALLRMMGGLVDRLLPPGGITGTLFVLGTPRRQRIGDLLAGTVVIRDPDRGTLPPAVWFPVPPHLEAFAGTIDPTAMTVDQYTVVRAFLLRARDLTPGARYAVATDLAERVARALGHQGPDRVHPEEYLLCAIARYQRRNFPGYQPQAWSAR
jgi:uncharacterized RDD family membrane protein YckC